MNDRILDIEVSVMKKFILNSIIIAVIILLSVIATVNIKENNKLTEKLEQQESKIKVLKEENGSLHDSLWNLNQQLMKEDANNE